VPQNKGNQHIGTCQDIVVFGNFFLSDGEPKRLLKNCLQLPVKPIEFCLQARIFRGQRVTAEQENKSRLFGLDISER